MAAIRWFFQSVLMLTLFIFLSGCDQFLPQIIASPTPTSSATVAPTWTATTSPTEDATATPTITPTATYFLLPTATYTPVGMPTATLPPTPTVASVKPNARAKFYGEFSNNGAIKFETNERGEIVNYLMVRFRCFGKDQILDLRAAGLKIVNGSFSYGTGGGIVWGRFTRPDAVTGTFSIEMAQGKNVCSVNSNWSASQQ